MSLSPDSQVKTVVLSHSSPVDTIETEQVDADEHREIVGWSWTVQGTAPTGDKYDLRAEAFIGSDPDITADDVRDLGGKWYTHAEYKQVEDTTNGPGLAEMSSHGAVDLPEGEGFDWNEDVTLTLKVDNGINSSSQAGFALVVYYREV